MAQELQAVIETLARSVHRAVAIDDLDFRLIAFTSHGGAVDPIRQAAILERQGPREATAWVRKLGVARAKGPMRIPANDELGMLPRICIPLRAHDLHLGYLWLVDPDESLSEVELRTAVVTADQCADLLHRERMHDALADARERELLRDLLGADAGVREMATAEVVAADLIDLRGELSVLAVGPVQSEAADAARTREAIAHAMDVALAGLPRRTCLRLIRPGHGVVVMTTSTLGMAPDVAAALAKGARGTELAVGVGGAVTQLGELGSSYQQAKGALRLTQVLPMFRPVARWTELGVYALLIELAGERWRFSALHPAVTTLYDAEPVLAETLERFLDRGGDTRAVAADLNVHRASVYYRLDRIRQLTGVDLSDGEQRLGLHLSLKIRRMQGQAEP
jgi:sugar diacid utilization regulator